MKYDSGGVQGILLGPISMDLGREIQSALECSRYLGKGAVDAFQSWGCCMGAWGCDKEYSHIF